jgi:hypothetical protein
MRALALLALLGGCAAADQALISEFVPTDPGTWRFEATATDTSYPLDSASAEATRLDWLRSDVINNHACPPNGDYVIEERRPVHVATSLIGVKTYRVIYDIVCI